MARTSLDDAHWASLMMVTQRIPNAWKRDEVGLRRFVAAVLWILRTGAPWRDLPDTLGHWPACITDFAAGASVAGGSSSSSTCVRRCQPTGWCWPTAPPARPFAPPPALRTARPRRSRSAGRAAGSAPRSTPAPTASAASCGSSTAPDTTRTCVTPGRSWQIFQLLMSPSTAATSRQGCGPILPHSAAPFTRRPNRGCAIHRLETRRSTPDATMSRTYSPASRTQPGSRSAATKRAAVGWASSTSPPP